MAIKFFKKSLAVTIRWKIVLIYCLLVFIAITIIGVFIMRNFEEYYINSVRSNLTNTVQGSTLISLSAFDNLQSHEHEIQAHIDAAWARTIQEQIFVIDSNMRIIASNTENTDRVEIERLDKDAILKAMISGENAESSGTISGPNTSIPIMSLVFPVFYRDTITGVVYIRTDMTAIYNTI
ncbi:MAG: cell wall metabolism sensor histidine kinase WalK, partial [Clostridiales bacterium]|nr:cell wall metabolism sensor histidine kinase WalK [Clostridiales bacterium]